MFNSVPTWTLKGAITPTWGVRKVIPRDYNDVVNYERYTPLSYWQKGADIIPSDTHQRVNQLKTYLSLYNGQYDRYFQDPLDTQIDMHYLFVDRLVNFLWQYPPELNFDWSDMVSDRFIQTLNIELKNSVIDLLRYGTGLVNVVNGRYGAEVQAPMPIYWFPANDIEDALLVPGYDGEGPHIVYKHGANGEWSRTEYHNDAGKLGRVLSSETETFGTPAAWDVIGMNSLGRASPMINFSLEPNTGEWGQSLYFTATPPALEAIRRFNGNSSTLTTHGNPREVYLPSEFPGDIKKGQGNQIEGQRAQMQIYYEVSQLETNRRSPVQILSRKYADVKYLYWEGSLEDHREQLNFALTMAFGMAYMPLSLVNLDGQLTIPTISGRALRFLYAPTHTRINNIQGIVKPVIKHVLLTAAAYNGHSAQAIQRFADRIVVDWPNIFEELDEEDDSGSLAMGQSIDEQEREPEEEAPDVVSTE